MQSNWIPEKTVIGLDNTFVKNFDAQVKTMLYAMYFKAGQTLDSSKDSKDLKEIQNALVKNFKRIEIPEFHIWTRFRTPYGQQYGDAIGSNLFEQYKRPNALSSTHSN